MVKGNELFKKKADVSQMSSLFICDKRQEMPICAKTIYSQVRDVLTVAEAHMAVGKPQSVMAFKP